MSRTIEWRHDGSRIVVPVIVYPPLTGTTFEGIAGNALIDTGSTTTGVTAGIAQKLGLQSIGKRLISTVGGEKHIDRYIFRIGLDGRAADTDAPTFPYVFEGWSGSSCSTVSASTCCWGWISCGSANC